MSREVVSCLWLHALADEGCRGGGGGGSTSLALPRTGQLFCPRGEGVGVVRPAQTARRRNADEHKREWLGEQMNVGEYVCLQSVGKYTLCIGQ